MCGITGAGNPKDMDGGVRGASFMLYVGHPLQPVAKAEHEEKSDTANVN